MKKTICITGATGAMGFETLREFTHHLDKFNLRLLVRDSKKNRRKLKTYLGMPEITVVWGDLMRPADVAEAIDTADTVLHIGGMVSPMADHYPEKTMRVNVGAAENIVNAIKARPDSDNVGLVYIGSVAQTSARMEPLHWGRTGDPIKASKYDYYGVSKIIAERVVAESGLKKWVSLRQSGILHDGLIFKGSDPISFHVPLRGVLEWATAEDSARLMVAICGDETPESFWRGFYNIGSGPAFRLTNYEFEVLLMRSLGCPPPEKVFEPGWFATHNFHGQWYMDSEKLEQMFHFRECITAEEYFARMSRRMPWWVRLAPLAPAWVVKWGMKQVALTKGLGTLDWLRRNDCEDRIEAFFGSREQQAGIPGWDKVDLSRPSDKAIPLNHGYDESKPDTALDIEDMQKAAHFRGGKCLSKSMTRGDLGTPLEWECAFGHRFTATPRLILKGGHWCPDCLPAPWRYEEEALRNPFLAQVMEP